MCGIAGIVNLESGIAPDSLVIERMTDSMVHRGPDGRGFFSDHHVAFGHRRLKIIDLSEAARQPMWDESKRYCITFNGEIYNYLELREDLLQKGYTFFSDSDTEVLLKAYIEYGISCIQKFIGMFAFAIYDKQTEKTIIVRDRIGVKPLFYSVFDGRLLFGSEIKAILQYPGFRYGLNKDAVSSYLSYRYPVGTWTLFDNVHSLLPGHYMEVSNGNWSVHQYYELPVIKEKEDMGEEFYLKKLRELMTSSVKYRMIADVPFGAYLSGGLDSSVVVALMSGLTSEPVKTFTIGFADEGYNEFSFAKQVADRYRSDHHEITLSAENYLDTMRKLIRFKDAPLGVANEPALHVMSAELKKFITVVLSGEGADEIFGGYGRIFRSPYDLERMKQAGPDQDKILANNLALRYGNKIFQNAREHFLYLYQYLKWEDKKQFLSDEFISELNEDKACNDYFDAILDRKSTRLKSSH